MKINEKFVIDTNILIYSFDQSSQFFNFSKKIIDDNKENVCIVYKTISEFVCVLSKIGKYDVIQNELPKIIDELNILFPDYDSTNHFNNLVKKYKPKGNQAYDFEIVSVMMANNIKKIATINKDDYKNITEIELI